MTLQRLVGNRAVSSVLSPLGSAAQQVRVHSDVSIPGNPDALARTEGFDIHLAPGAPAPGTPAGDMLLAHEAAHVVQQTRPGPAVSRQVAEDEADAVMVAAIAGKPQPGSLSPASGPQDFEARWHQATLTNAMDAVGFTDEEQQEAYWTNWCRDVSQAFVPIARDTIGFSATMSLLNTLSQMKFGKPVPPSLMGMYEPRQHIDNPAGQISADLVQSDTPSVDVGTGTLTGRPDPSMDPQGQGPANQPSIRDKMAVDASGVPAYINDSKAYIFEEVEKAFAAGRSAEGLHAMGNFTHTIQDLFAHSNWVEVAVSKVIEDGSVKLPPADPTEDTPAGRVAARIAEARKKKIPIVENFSADVVDSAGAARPILQTGTFSGKFGMAGHDTLISLKEELANILREHSPFGAEGGGSGGRKWELTLGVLDAIDKAGAEGKVADIVVNAIQEKFDGARDAAKRALESLPANARERAENISVAGYQLDESNRVGAAARWLLGTVAEQGASVVSSAGSWTVDKLDGALRSARSHIREAVTGVFGTFSLVATAEEIKSKYKSVKHVLDDIKKGIKDLLPETIARPLVNAIDSALEWVSEKVNSWMEKQWQAGVNMVMEKLGKGGTFDVAESNVAQKVENLQADGKTMEERLAAIEKLKERTVAAIRAANAGEKGDAAIDKILNLPLPQALVYLSSPSFSQLLADLSSEAAAAGEELASEVETAVRVQQIEELPEWARQGASHSQVAKDHADSPFFGLAFTMANTVDTTVARLMMNAWTEMQGGTPAPAPGFEGEFSYSGPETGPDVTRDAARERQRDFLNNRAMGSYVVQFGTPDELEPVMGLARAGDYLESFLSDRADQRERRAKKHEGEAQALDPLPIGLAPLIASVRRPDQAPTILALLATARLVAESVSNPEDAIFSRAGEDWRVANHLEPTFHRIERLARQVTHRCAPGETAEQHAVHAGMHRDGESAREHAFHAGVCVSGETEEEHAAHLNDVHEGETPAEHLAHAVPEHPGETPEQHAKHAEKTEVFHQEQIDALNRMRGRAGGRDVERLKAEGRYVEGRFATGAQVRARDREIEAIREPKERLRREIERIFTHPYESNWWRPTVVAWCNAHQALLIDYIDKRNRGVAHHHPH